MTLQQLKSYVWPMIQIWLGVSQVIILCKFVPYQRLFQGLRSPVTENTGVDAPGTPIVEPSLKPSDRSTQDIVDEAGVSYLFHLEWYLACALLIPASKCWTDWILY